MSRRNSLVALNRRSSVNMTRSSIQQESISIQPIKIEIKAADMDQNTQRHVESFAIEAFETLTSEKEVAAAIRERMDTSYGPYWNVIVGNHFGSDVTHVTKQYIQLEYGTLTIVVWKSS